MLCLPLLFLLFWPQGVKVKKDPAFFMYLIYAYFFAITFIVFGISKLSHYIPFVIE